MLDHNKQIKIIKLFNSIVLEDNQKTVDLDHSLTAKNGVITNFAPSDEQKKAIKEVFQKINITTLFGKKERENSSPEELIMKQILHYIEIYGLDMPGLFDLEVTKGKILSITFLKGITQKELVEKVHKLIYANAPIRDVALVKGIIEDFSIDYDMNLVSNNELRIQLFDWTKHTLNNGDDVVRYICYKATNNTMLIKSKEVLEAVQKLQINSKFIRNHEMQLANVFNRHKNIILSLKNVGDKDVNSAINRVTRLSKKHHKPIKQAINKHFVSLALAGKVNDSVLDKISIRDKFKYLNLLEYKKQGFSEDVFIIRNGKLHLEKDRTVYTKKDLNRVIKMVVESLKTDLSYLKDERILVDKNVDFGLPVSRKQTLGRVPFGTKVTVDNSRKISSGVYWENAWGARDLDLSTIDKNGNRIGWGYYSAYDNSNDVIFSGDVTNAPSGGMEFMTSSNSEYGLFVNIFSGEVGTEFELVVGTDGKDKWIKDTVFREKSKLESRGTIIGFVDGHTFTVFNARMNNGRTSRSSRKVTGVVHRGTGEFWTVSKLLDAIGVKYDTKRKDGVTYDSDLSYNSFSYDLLEDLFYKDVKKSVDKAA